MDEKTIQSLMSLLGTYGSGNADLNKGLFNYKNPEKGLKFESIINSGISTGLTAGMQFLANKNNPTMNASANAMGAADAVSSSMLSMASKVPGPVGMIGSILSLGNQIGGLLNGFKANDMKKAGVFDETSAFGGATALQDQNINDMQAFNQSGLIGQLFGKKKTMKNNMNQLRVKGKTASNLITFNNKLKSNASAASNTLGALNNMSLSGFNYDDVQFGKTGLKMEAPKVKKLPIYKKQTVHAIDEVRKESSVSKREVLAKMNEIYSTQRKLKEQIRDIEKLVTKRVEIKKDGGPINIIPDGLLHANKHNLTKVLDHTEPEITNKGIPVVMEDGGSITQVAEIERDEIILHLELTKKLEELKKDGSEEAMIEAGKILSKEIVKNTRDSKSKLLKG